MIQWLKPSFNKPKEQNILRPFRQSSFSICCIDVTADWTLLPSLRSQDLFAHPNITKPPFMLKPKFVFACDVFFPGFYLLYYVKQWKNSYCILWFKTTELRSSWNLGVLLNLDFFFTVVPLKTYINNEPRTFLIFLWCIFLYFVKFVVTLVKFKILI